MDYSRMRIVAAVIVGIAFLLIAVGMFEFVRALITFDPARDTAREMGPAQRQ
jgi:hypothetical protein